VFAGSGAWIALVGHIIIGFLESSLHEHLELVSPPSEGLFIFIPLTIQTELFFPNVLQYPLIHACTCRCTYTSTLN